MRHAPGYASLGRYVGLVAWLGACAPAVTQAPPPLALNANPQPVEAAPQPAPRPIPAVPESVAAPNVAPLPAGVEPGVVVRVPLPDYRAAFVVHGQPGTRRALVYLHGICGNVDKIRDWAPAVAGTVTTIAVYGNKECPTSAIRFSWNQDVEFIHNLIQVALARVADARGGQLDVEQVVLFGYSQGASRAERLVERHPERYPWLILGGPPKAPEFAHIERAHRSALLVGTEEHQEHLADVAEELTTRGVPTRFDTFAGAGHGGFGASAPAVMSRTLTWLLAP